MLRKRWGGGVAPISNERKSYWSKQTQPEAPKTKKGFFKGFGNWVSSKFTKKNKQGDQEEKRREDFENLNLSMFSGPPTSREQIVAANVVFPTLNKTQHGASPVRMLKRNRKTGKEEIVFRQPGEYPYVNEKTGAESRYLGGFEDYTKNTGPVIIDPINEAVDYNQKAVLLEQRKALGFSDPLPSNPNPLPLPPRDKISPVSFSDPNKESIINVEPGTEVGEEMPNNMKGQTRQRIVSKPSSGNMVFNTVGPNERLVPAYNPPTNAQKQMLAERAKLEEKAVVEELEAVKARKDAGVGYRGLGGSANKMKQGARIRAAARRAEQQQTAITQPSRLGPRGAVKGPNRQAAMTRSTGSMYLPPPVTIDV